MIPIFWYRWLYAVIIGVMIFGISMVLVPDLIRQFFSVVLYSTPSAIESDFGSEANRYIVLSHGVLGSVMFGWGTAMLTVLHGPFRRREPTGWLSIALSLAAWYLPDTLFSLYTGFWQNAILNTVIVMLFAIPLGACHKYFRTVSPQK